MAWRVDLRVEAAASRSAQCSLRLPLCLRSRRARCPLSGSPLAHFKERTKPRMPESRLLRRRPLGKTDCCEGSRIFEFANALERPKVDLIHA